VKFSPGNIKTPIRFAEQKKSNLFVKKMQASGFYQFPGGGDLPDPGTISGKYRK